MEKIKSLTLRSADYPENLAQIPDAPKKLFFLGVPPMQWLDSPKLAVVGSRKMTGYGRDITSRLVGELTRYGVVIISGLALGIDSVAHKACLENGGTTAAVLPTGLDKIYPASHRNLAIRILQNKGTLLSEYPEGSVPFKVNFLARNRIVSGLADALLITEASARSGTMSTAAFALEQGKTVMAVPGSVNNPSSQGTNNLIKSGANIVTDVSDVLLAMNIPLKKTSEAKFHGTDEEARVMKAVASGIGSPEELALNLSIDAAQLSYTLTNLEINGYIKSESGLWFLV